MTNTELPPHSIAVVSPGEKKGPVLRNRLDWFLGQLRPVTDVDSLMALPSQGTAAGSSIQSHSSSGVVNHGDPYSVAIHPPSHAESRSSGFLRKSVLVLVVLLALLLSLRNLTQPIMVVEAINGRVTVMPMSLFVAGLLGFVVAWTLLLTGAFRSSWLFRLVILLVFTATFGAESVYGLLFQGSRLDSVLTAMAWFQVGILVAVWALLFVGPWIFLRQPSNRQSGQERHQMDQANISAALSLPNEWSSGVHQSPVLGDSAKGAEGTDRARSAETKEGGDTRSGLVWVGITFFLLLVLFYASAATYSILSRDRYYVAFFPKMLTDPLSFASVLLLPAPLLAVARYSEWGGALGERLARTLERRSISWGLYGLCWLVTLPPFIVVLISIAPKSANSSSSSTDSVVSYFAGFLDLLFFGSLLALLFWGILKLLMVMGHIGEWPRMRISGVALATALVVFLAVLIPALNISPAVLIILLPLTLLGGVVTLIAGRRHPRTAGIIGLYLLIFTLFSLTFNDLELLVAPTTVAVLLWILIRRGVRGRGQQLLGYIFSLNIAILVVIGIANLYTSKLFSVALSVTDRFTPLQAIILLPPVIVLLLQPIARPSSKRVNWFFGTSLPVLLAGYLLLTMVIAVYIAAETYRGTLIPAGGVTGGNDLSALSLETFGPSIVITSFLIAVAIWNRKLPRKVAPKADPEMDSVPLVSPNLQGQAEDHAV